MHHLNKTLSVLALTLAVGSAEAAVATASATINWSTFNVRFIAIGANPAPSITWSGQNAWVDAATQVPADSQSDWVGDWTNPLAVTANPSGSTTSSASANVELLTSFTYDSNLSWSSQAWSSAYRGGDFSVTGSGILLFSVDYSLTASLTAPGDSASASANLYAYRTGSNFSASAYDSVYVGRWNANQSPLNVNDTLHLALFVQDGQNYNFTSSAYSSASAVPVPSAVWLFLSAVVGFLGVNRHKRALSV
ncbi:MAG: hypothetical protein KGZ80_11995 [Methylomonas sp.]|nr:hypothetical protein [Methylomonas sp.]